MSFIVILFNPQIFTMTHSFLVDTFSGSIKTVFQTMNTGNPNGVEALVQAIFPSLCNLLNFSSTRAQDFGFKE